MLQDAFGCSVANRFGDLLDDDAADPFDLMSEVELEKERRKKKKQKEEEERRSRQKKPGLKESQRNRRAPVALDVQNPVPGELDRVHHCESVLVGAGGSGQCPH